MKTYKFKFPFQGNRKGDIVTEDMRGQLLVKAGPNNVMWGPKDVFRAVGMGLIEDITTMGYMRSVTGIPKGLFGNKDNGTGANHHTLMRDMSKIVNRITDDVIRFSQGNAQKREANAMRRLMGETETLSEFKEQIKCSHPSARRENDEMYCDICKKRWEAADGI